MCGATEPFTGSDAHVALHSPPVMQGLDINDVNVLSAVSGKGFRQFLRMPRAIYATDPHWVHPLLIERKQHLSRRNPVFQHLRWHAWVALRDGRCVGRISAQIDQLHLQRYADDTGFFGMLESIDDPAVFGALLKTAEDWLRERGMRRVRGPFNLNINEECGLLIDGFDTPPSMMMGHARPYYRERLEQCGYVGAADTLAYIMPPQYAAPPVMQKLLAHVKKRTVVRVLRRERLDEELGILREIFNDAWSENWGFLPFTEAEFAEIGRAMLHLADPDMVQIAEVDGRPAAMIVALPNLNEIIADMGGRLFPFNWARLLWRLKVRYPRTARVPLMGVMKEFQNTRMGPGLAFALIDAEREVLFRRGIESVELSWILADNLGMRNIIESLGGVAYKRYRLFEKTLDL